MDSFKKILTIIIIGLLVFNVFSFFYMRSVKTFSPVIPEIQNITEMPSYASELQFFPNMRFNHNNLTFLIEDNCNMLEKEKIALAFSRIEQESNNLLTFHKTRENPDILVMCNSSQIINQASKFFIAGEGGPERAIKSGVFYVIEKGTILLYSTFGGECANYNVELHELLHVLGFTHSDNHLSVMYNISKCNQVITRDIIDEIVRLYSIPAYPDVSVENITALKHGTYLDFEANVKNIGLNKAENIIMGISSKGQEIESFNLGTLEYGEGKILAVENIKIPISLLTLKELTFSLSIESSELDYENNNITLVLNPDRQ